jgi:signal transduction histidine kinase
MLSVQRAQRLARQQMEFVAGVSHELRTPLAVICSAGENLADGVIDDRQQIQRYGEVIRNEGRRLTEMVEQVLEFAGIQSGRKAYNISSVDVASVIERALLALEPALSSDHFKIEKQVASYLPPVMADSSALSRAIQNLLDNAMKYSGDSRWIGVSARTEVLDGKFEVQIAVSDKGMGIAPADMLRVFEPFHRGQATVAAQIHGSGLGLSLVKHILEAHGGRVDVRSVEGQGSAFTLHLPAEVGSRRSEVRDQTSEVRPATDPTSDV